MGRWQKIHREGQVQGREGEVRQAARGRAGKGKAATQVPAGIQVVAAVV
jgi:hypothetical protein